MDSSYLWFKHDYSKHWNYHYNRNGLSFALELLWYMIIQEASLLYNIVTFVINLLNLLTLLLKSLNILTIFCFEINASISCES